VKHLDVISPQFLAGLWLIAAVALVLAVLTAVRRRRRWLLRFGLGLVALLVVGALAAADTVNAHYAYLPTLGDVRDALTGDRQWVPFDRIRTVSYWREKSYHADGAIVRMRQPADPANGFGVTTTIAYLPPQYFAQPTRRFPVVYLLHGSPGRPQDWFHGGNAKHFGEELARAGHPAILVAPQLSRSWTDDPECVDGHTERVESHFIGVVIPSVDGQLRTIPQRTARVFAGMSAGGYCALNLGLRHRNLVATIVDLSGYTVPTHDHGAASLFGHDNPIAAQLVAANSPALYVTDLANGPPCRIWLDTGTSDRTIEREMAAVAPQLRQHGIEVAWRIRRGGHDYYVWNSALTEAMPWALGAAPGHDKANPSRPGP